LVHVVNNHDAGRSEHSGDYRTVLGFSVIRKISAALVCQNECVPSLIEYRPKGTLAFR
jgi:hypothetical protein